jgi:hypothetical protein
VSTLAITAITNFILAAELFFLAGMMVKTPKSRFSAAWFWGGAMLALATSALLGGIDHGFVESAGLSREPIQRPNWIVLGVATFCVLLATARQFFPPGWQRPALVVATVQLVVYAVAVLVIGDFSVAILNYAPVVLLLLAMSVRGLKDGTGSWQMVVGILVLLAASAAQALRVDALSPLDHDGLYHVIFIVGAPFLYLGGQRLKTTRPASTR